MSNDSNLDAEAQKKAQQEKDLKAQMEARGYDPDNPAHVDQWRKLQENTRIDEKERHRRMDDHVSQEEDKKRRDDAKQQQQDAPGPQGKDTESKRIAYSKELEEEVKAGRIDEREKVYREQRFDNQLAMEVRLPGQTVEVPTPRQEAPQQRPLEIDPRQQERERQEQFVKTPMDWERMLTDRSYRKQMEEQMKDERDFRLQQQERENAGQQRPGGRER
jgi:hypothetical protein